MVVNGQKSGYSAGKSVSLHVQADNFMAKRLSRFLIDKVDERLGDVEKEKKFDIIMIVVGVVSLLAGFLILALSPDTGVAVVIAILLLMLGVALTISMVKEYIADCAKAKARTPSK